MINEHRNLGKMTLFELLTRQITNDVPIDRGSEVEVAVSIESLLIGVFVYLLSGIF